MLYDLVVSSHSDCQTHDIWTIQIDTHCPSETLSEFWNGLKEKKLKIIVDRG